MSDPSQSQPQKQDKPPVQDTKEEITKSVNELKEHIYKSLESDDTDPYLIERVNQIFNDVLAAIPPDVQEPKYQRATMASTMTKLREQLEAAIRQHDHENKHAEGLISPIKDAEKKAKEADEKKGTQQPAGPSQSPQNFQPEQPAQVQAHRK